jgi:hypothetical protein
MKQRTPRPATHPSTLVRAQQNASCGPQRLTTGAADIGEELLRKSVTGVAVDDPERKSRQRLAVRFVTV